MTVSDTDVDAAAAEAAAAFREGMQTQFVFSGMQGDAPDTFDHVAEEVRGLGSHRWGCC